MTILRSTVLLLMMLAICFLYVTIANEEENNEISNSKVTIHPIKVPEVCEHKVQFGDKVAITFTGM